MRVEIVRAVIAADAIVAEMKAGADGAVCVFDGIVRDNTRGRKTLHLDYEAYEEMALEQMRGLAAEAVTKFGVRDVALVHRLGRLVVGETSVLVVVASAHRGAAFDACRVADRYAEEDCADLEEGAVCGWGGVGGWGAVSGGRFRSARRRCWRCRGMRFGGDVVLGSRAVLLQGLMAQAPVERRAPQDKEQVPTLRVETRLVNLPLNVVDEKGVPVAGLERDDFEILEDGKLQKIAIFEKESVAPLSIVLSIDASESVLRDERLEKDAAKHFLRALIREQDEVDLMEFADTVREVVPFTNQVKRVETGLNELQHGADTALYDAIYLASDVLAKTKGDAGRRRVMVLITDGGDTVKRGRGIRRRWSRRSGRGRWCTRSSLCRCGRMRGGIRVGSMR